MQKKIVGGVELNYETFGNTGPWLTLCPGGRRSMQELVPMAKQLVAQGLRVLLHDRRNCGASETEISGVDAEYEIWADDLHHLLNHLGIHTVIAGGSSSGARLALSLALRHPETVCALVLWRLTGGAYACERLAEKYYGKYIALARESGMATVCSTDEFAETIAARPMNREKLTNLPVAQFIDVMQGWADYFHAAADHPLIGATEQDLQGLKKPVLIVPGNDKSHPRVVAENAARLLPMAQLKRLNLADHNMDVSPEDEWKTQEETIVALIGAFVAKNVAQNQ